MFGHGTAVCDVTDAGRDWKVCERLKCAKKLRSEPDRSYQGVLASSWTSRRKGRGCAEFLVQGLATCRSLAIQRFALFATRLQIQHKFAYQPAPVLGGCYL